MRWVRENILILTPVRTCYVARESSALMETKLHERNQGAANDITIAAEFLMVALRELIRGRKPTEEAVQEPIRWAIRKLNPLDTKST